MHNYLKNFSIVENYFWILIFKRNMQKINN